jgi:hypothetical protein
MRRPIGLTPHPAGHVSFWCPRPDPNGPIQIDSDTKMGRSPGDALTPQTFVGGGIYSGPSSLAGSAAIFGAAGGSSSRGDEPIHDFSTVLETGQAIRNRGMHQKLMNDLVQHIW